MGVEENGKDEEKVFVGVVVVLSRREAGLINIGVV